MGISTVDLQPSREQIYSAIRLLLSDRLLKSVTFNYVDGGKTTYVPENKDGRWDRK